jgi:hypothetical protein
LLVLGGQRDLGICPRYVTSSVWPPTGHVFRVERACGPARYMKYRLPNGRQVQRPARIERGRPPAGYFTKGLARGALRSCARRGSTGGRCRGSCGPARRSRTPRPNTCATSSRTADASRRRFATTLDQRASAARVRRPANRVGERRGDRAGGSPASRNRRGRGTRF